MPIGKYIFVWIPLLASAKNEHKSKASEPHWGPAQIVMTAPSSKELVQTVAGDLEAFQGWGESLRAAGILNRDFVSSAQCTAKVQRPIGEYDLPLAQTAQNRIECSVRSATSSAVNVVFSLADMPLERWGTHWLKNAFTVSGKYSQILFKIIGQNVDAQPVNAPHRMLSDDFICDPRADYCLDGTTLHQTPIEQIDETTYAAISCDRETEISKQTKADIKEHYAAYVKMSAQGPAAAAQAKKIYNAYLAQVYGQADDGKAMLEDQLSRGVRVLVSVKCTWLETDKRMFRYMTQEKLK